MTPLRQGDLGLARIRELLAYDHVSGLLTWRWSGHGVTCGEEAGSIDRKTGYRRVRIDGHNYQAHRVIWLLVTGAWPKVQIDHINTNRADNRFENLREASGSENQWNKHRRANSPSGLKWVSWDDYPGNKRWAWAVQARGHTLRGYSKCKVAAHLAAVVAANILHGKFARAE